MRTYTPAEAAERSGFSVDTLRYYEREGILAPVARTAGGRRTYSDSDLSTLDFLRCLRDAGMPIERLRRYGELCRDPNTIAERIALLREHAVAVDNQIDQLRRYRARVDEKIAWYEGSAG
ncbi:MerR family transcriptional regulator [Micromonospora zingiberis]|uniref:MerR family transcriptional regulator n=1 Tax=Micromonospora zingiberis TaxID=2053011 RepID=A0A4R0GRZ2_9ACTN|nr:MerR family transcriptional regulator [Micromonospora zingiberis]TCC00401.1 MerR family transcriptional regulator [Micromonospora zingiberis]